MAMTIDPRKALVLFSGGQDSTTCLAWALDRYDAVETVGFDYGQRHAVELEARPRVLAAIRADFPQWAGKLGADHVLPLDVLKAIGGTALTDDMKIEMGENGLPTTFVPGRNILFLTAAAALAYRRGIATWSAACARPISPAIPIAATTRSRRPKPRSISAWTRISRSRRR